MTVPRKPLAIACLGTSHTLAWASSYLPAVLVQPMARELGVTPATVFAAFSLALVASAAPAAKPGETTALPSCPSHSDALLLSAVFAMPWFTSTAMAAHLPVLQQAQGLLPAAALSVAALSGRCRWVCG